jgi:uncharacterized MAPEG superfamily protein
MVAAVAVALLIWAGTFRWLPPIGGMTTSIGRIALSVECIAVAGAFTLLLMIEAVAHERLRSAAFDPLLGVESERLRVNVRVLQNTLEQFALFAPALLVVALHCRDGSDVRALVAATIVWTVARFAFWIGYHIGPWLRLPGLVGYAQTMVMLLYGVAQAGYDRLGWAGGLAPPLAFAAVECTLIFATRSPPADQPDGRR